MKKILTLVFLFSAAFSSAQDLSFIKSGDFATYHDQRGSMDFFRAYCCLHVEDGSSFFLIKNINNRTGESINYIAVIALDENDGLMVREVKGYSQDQSPEQQQSVFDLLNFLDFTRVHLDMITGKTALIDRWESYDQYYLFDDSRLPLFMFTGIALNDPENVRYSLKTMGNINHEKADMFFNLEPFSAENYLLDGKAILNEGDRERVSLNDYSLLLDNNWEYNDALGFPGYWISNYTMRDAQIMLEEMDFGHILEMGYGLKDFVYTSSFIENQRVVYDGFEVTEEDDMITVSKYLIDEEGHYNYSRARFWLEGETLYSLNFSAFAFMYDSRKEYFDSVISSFQKD